MSFGVVGASLHDAVEKRDGPVERALLDELCGLGEARVAVGRGGLSEQRGGAHCR